MSFWQRNKPESKQYKCPLHGPVVGVFPTFADHTVNVRMCERCIALMFMRHSEIVEPIEEK